MGVGRNIRLGAMTLLCAAGCWPGSPAEAQQAVDMPTELQQLSSQLKQIQARIEALERAQLAPGQPLAVAAPVVAASSSSTAAASTPPPAEPGMATGPEAVKQAQDQGMDTMDAGMGGDVINIPHMPQIKFRGFGDVRASLANQNQAVLENTPGYPTPATQGGRRTFSLGLMDLFLTSQISEHFAYLAEIGFEADKASNGVGVDLERAQLSFTPSDKLAMTFGRSHAMLGYYNSAFHHGTWFQTTIDRPRIFEFEDSGGPLPIHNVGVAAMGKVGLGGVGLHWFAEAGNGKQTYSLSATVTPTNVLSDHTGKSTNIGFNLRPERWSSLQTGFNWYQASLVPVTNLLPGYGSAGFAFPNAASYYHQNIFVAHAIYITPKLELMAEGVEIGDTPRGSNRPLYLSGGYAQVSRSFSSLRPYFRYEWMNPNFHDPNNAWVGRWVGPLGGLRWDLNTFIAVKFEVQHYDWKKFSADASGTQLLPVLHKSVNSASTQITYTF